MSTEYHLRLIILDQFLNPIFAINYWRHFYDLPEKLKKNILFEQKPDDNPQVLSFFSP